ncbi:MAG: FHA domain-containing protein [Anaerolineae bacterium]|nr:FHA domain-containing protein [Anaerolineae bacterium]
MKKTHAWLVSSNGRDYQLNQGQTTIGRAASNDILIADDPTVSALHAKIVAENGQFRLYDLGSTKGIKVNQRWMRGPLLLAPDDQIQLGDQTVLQFVTANKNNRF